MSDHEIEQEQRRYDEAQDANDRAYAEGFAAGVATARDRAEKVLVEYLGERGPVPETRDQWGPRCAGCPNDEYRIDGYCSVECREYSCLSNALLAALSSLDKEENHAV